MITAERSDHKITRNSKFFKVINETCYEKALELLKQKPNIKTATIGILARLVNKRAVPAETNEGTARPITENESRQIEETARQNPTQLEVRDEANSAPAITRESLRNKGEVDYKNAYRMYSHSKKDSSISNAPR